MNKLYIKGLVQHSVLYMLGSLLSIPTDEIYADSTIVDDLGCDGLDAIEIIMRIEYTLNISIDDKMWLDPDNEESVNPALTVQEIIDYCFGKVKEALTSEENYELIELSLKPTD